LTPDRKGILITGGRGSIQLWDLAAEQMVSSFEPDLSGNITAGQAGTYVYHADIDPTGRWIIANGQVWDVSTGQELLRLTPAQAVSSAIFSPSGKLIASGGANTVRLWNSEDGEELMHVPVEPFTGAASLVFSQDEKWLVGADGTMIHIWETSTGREVARILTSIVKSVDLSPDGKWVASGNADNTIHVWPWRPEDLFAQACFRLPRNLTQEEWSLYVGNEPYQSTCPNLPIPTE
jgi:WD40 repeat protein